MGFSDDHGNTWKLGGILGDYTNECQLTKFLESAACLGLSVAHFGPGVMTNGETDELKTNTSRLERP